MTPLDTPAIRKAWDAWRNASHGTRQHYRRAYEAAVREQLEREVAAAELEEMLPLFRSAA